MEDNYDFIVRSAVTLGLPINLVTSLSNETTVRDDYRTVVKEISGAPNSN